MKAVVLINGSAAIALMAFTANVAQNPKNALAPQEFAGPIAVFALGVLAGALAFGFVYLAQWNYHRNYESSPTGESGFLKSGDFWNRMAKICAAAGYLTFLGSSIWFSWIISH